MPSHAVNGAMTIIGLTGWGAPIAAGYFVIDTAVSGYYKGGVSGYIDKKFGPIVDF